MAKPEGFQVESKTGDSVIGCTGVVEPGAMGEKKAKRVAKELGNDWQVASIGEVNFVKPEA